MTHVAGFLRRRVSQSVQEWIALESVCVLLLMRLQCQGWRYIITCHTQTLGWDLIGCGDQVQVWDCKGKHAPEPRVDSAIVENLTDAAPVWRRGTQAL